MSAKNTSFSVGEPMQQFIHQQVETGRYASASEVVRAGLRLLEQSEAAYQLKLEALRAALKEGEDSGPALPFDFDEFLARKRREHNAR